MKMGRIKSKVLVAEFYSMGLCAWQLQVLTSTSRKTTFQLRKFSKRTLTAFRNGSSKCVAIEKQVLFNKDERNDRYNNKEKSMLELQMRRAMHRSPTENTIQNTKLPMIKSKDKKQRSQTDSGSAPRFNGACSQLRPGLRVLVYYSLECVCS